jgi:hypothetical protein
MIFYGPKKLMVSKTRDWINFQSLFIIYILAAENPARGREFDYSGIL